MLGLSQMKKRDAARRKLLRILPLNAVERLSGLASPWYAKRADVVDAAVARWDADEVEEAIQKVLKIASAV